MRLTTLIRSVLFILLATVASSVSATTFNLGSATDTFAPSFRGASNSTYVGWDLFDDNGAGDMIINDQTPDLGTGSGSFVTTNGEDHLSGSMNYYSGSGAVAEDISFSTDGANGDGFTTVIVQGKTLFGGFGAEIAFGDIDGIAPSLVLQTNNAADAGQFFAKYELPGTADTESLSISTGPASFISFDKIEIDTIWSADGYAADTAIVPEPTGALAVLLGAIVLITARRR